MAAPWVIGGTPEMAGKVFSVEANQEHATATCFLPPEAACPVGMEPE